MKRKQAHVLTRNHLRDAIHRKFLGLSLKDARSYVDAVIDEICDALVRGDDVGLHKFGKFSVRVKRERPGLNVWAGERVSVSARRVVRFRSSPVLLQKLNGIALDDDVHPEKALAESERPPRVTERLG
ncbi:HU family DNA-binding protein [Methylocystis parvus]|uniref:HU family DNA-binding protein n=1 Tax=Methylocystis parvus TaxID=134 RepID=UPI003C71E53E